MTACFVNSQVHSRCRTSPARFEATNEIGTRRQMECYPHKCTVIHVAIQETATKKQGILPLRTHSRVNYQQTKPTNCNFKHQAELDRSQLQYPSRSTNDPRFFFASISRAVEQTLKLLLTVQRTDLPQSTSKSFGSLTTDRNTDI